MAMLYMASSSPCFAACLYQRIASARSWFTPRPCAYITPRLFCAFAFPCSADLRNHWTACSSSCGTPFPSSYARPSSNCACGSPDSARLTNSCDIVGETCAVAETTRRKAAIMRAERIHIEEEISATILTRIFLSLFLDCSTKGELAVRQLTHE